MRCAPKVASLLLASILLSSVPVFAQSDADKAAARSLAAEGAKAMDEKRWADAIDRFTRAESLVHAPPHLLYLARAHVALGKLVIARETYLKIVKETLAPAQPKAFHAAKKDAEKELAELEPRIPSLKVDVEGADAATVAVTMDGVAVPPALIGVARPVDPGSHTLEATAPGLAGKATVDVKEGAKETVAIKLEKVVVAPPPKPKDPDPPPPPPPADAPSKVPAIVAFSVGGVGLIVGTVFLLQKGSKTSKANEICTPICPPSRRDEINQLDSQAKTAGTLSIVSYVVGAVGIGAGVVLLLTSSPSKPASSAYVQPMVGLGFVGVSGAF